MRKDQLAGMFSLIILIVLAASYSKSNAKSKEDPNGKKGANQKIVRTDSLNITLNGVLEDLSKGMHNHFLKFRGQDKHPVKESVWFDKKTFHLMLKLLLKERGNKNLDESDSGQTDGLRIYFVSDTSISAGRLKNSIVLVSTKTRPFNPSYPLKSTHYDYYRHPMDSLFWHLDSIHGLVTIRPWFFFNFTGATLYNPYPRFLHNDDYPECADPYHYISQGKANKMVNQFGRDAITTEGEWFDIKLLVALDSDTTHDGIRIYFTRHPFRYKAVADNDSNKEAFVLITTKSVRNKHVDYFDCNTTKDYYEDLKLREQWEKEHRLFGGGGNDNGELCPTYCN